MVCPACGSENLRNGCCETACAFSRSDFHVQTLLKAGGLYGIQRFNAMTNILFPGEPRRGAPRMKMAQIVVRWFCRLHVDSDF